MRERLEIDPADGSLALQPSGRAVAGGQPKAEVEALLADFFGGTLDHGNGYAWSSFSGFDFGGMPCWLSAGFHDGRLNMVLMGVALTGAKEEDGWPTQQAIDNEIAFMRRTLHKQLGRNFGNHAVSFPWGEAWSRFDPKGFMASAGVSYV